MQDPPRILVFVALLAIAAGVAFRVAGLDRGVYGFDETVTALRVAGATLPELDRDLATRSLPSLGAIVDRYQRAGPRSSFEATVTSLAIDDPQHPPLYYLLARVWRAFGDGVPVRRSLALIFGLALVPATWWFARTTFDCGTAWIMTALVAVSPFHAAFAAYDREYGLWALFCALASGALVCALRTGSARWWIAYAVLATAGLYADTFFLDVLVAHGVYVTIVHRSLSHERVVHFGLAAAAAVLAFAPWIVTIATHWGVVTKTTGWNAAPLPARLLLEKWVFETTTVFFDAEYLHAIFLPVALLVLLVAVVAAASAFGRRDRSGIALAAALFVVPALVLVIPDVVAHESRSTATRYLTPAWFGLEALVAAGLAGALVSASRLRRVSSAVAAAVLLIAGAVSGTFALRDGSPWMDAHDAPLTAVAHELDRRPNGNLCYIDGDETALIMSDAVRGPMRLSATCRDGSFAVATPDEIALVPARGGVFRPVAVDGRDASGNAMLARAHAESGRAHAVVAQDRALWSYVER